MKKVSIFLTILILVGIFSPLIPEAKAAYGNIYASPSYFDGNSSDGPFTSYITWNSGGFDQVSRAVVYVSLNGGEETLFSYQNSCSGTNCPANWIYPSNTEQRYEFRLYEYNSFTGWVGDLLGKATVVVSPKSNNQINNPQPTTPTNPTTPTYNPRLTINKTQFYNTDTWNLSLTGGPANQRTYICAIDNKGVQSCTPTGNLGLPSHTDSNGNWYASGNWNGDESVLGNWTEWMYVGGTLSNGVVTGGVRSNNINFTIIKKVQTCQGSPTLVITPSTASVNKNSTQSFQALYDPDGPSCPQGEQNVTNNANWISLNTSIAQLVSLGTFRGISAGQTQVRATYQNISAHATLSVLDDTPTYNPRLTINKTQFYNTDTWNLSLTGGPANQRTYICAIDNKGVQSCTPTGNLGLPSHTDSNGNWYASGNWNGDESVLGNWTEWMYVGGTLSNGVVTGGVRSNNINFTIIKKVQTCQGSPTLVITPSTASVNKNSTQSFQALYDPDGPSCPQGEQNVTLQANWQSNNYSIVSYQGNGVFKGMSAGIAQINVSYNNLRAYATITVIDNTNQTCQGSPTLVIRPSTASVNKNSTQSFQALYDPDGPSCPQGEQNVTNNANWTSLNTSIAQLVSLGTFRGISAGQTQVRATYQNISAHATLSVLDDAQTGGSLPIATTQPATNISKNTATLNGLINPNNNVTSYRFEYGRSPSNLIYSTSFQIINGSSNQQVSAFISNLSANTTYYFRVTAYNDYGEAKGQILSFTTQYDYVDSNISQAPTVQTLYPTYISGNSATLNARVNPNNSATQYRFEYGTNQSLGYFTSWQSIGSGSIDSNVFAQVYNLLPNTTYYFRVVAQNQYGVSQGQILSFRTDFVNQGNAPQVYTDPASSINYNSAVLNGRINPNNSNTSYYFEYGTTNYFGYRTPFQSIGSGSVTNYSVSAYVSGLNPDTTYYYRLVGQNSYGVSYGETYTFRTNSNNWNWWGIGNMPDVSTEQATNIYQNYATLNARVKPNGADTQVWFEYGTNSNYLSYTSNYSNAGSNYSYNYTSQTVYNLLPNTTYYFRAVARNQYGVAYGQILSFTTTGGGSAIGWGSAPIVKTTPATYISQNSALLNGFVNPNNGLTSAWIEYGPNTSLGLRTNILPMGSANYELPYSFAVSGLLPNTIYYFRVVGQNQYGTSYGQILSFQTLGSQITYAPTTPQTPSTQVIAYQTSGFTQTSQPSDYGKQIDCLTIVPSINGKTLDPGNEFTYITTIRNNCNFTLENSVLRVILPQETDFISTSFPTYSLDGNAVIFNVGKIDPNVQIAINTLGRIKNNSKNGDHLIFTSILNFNYRNYSYMVNTYLTAIVGQEISGGFAAAFKTIGSIFTSWIFWLIFILLGLIWFFYFLFTRKLAAKEERYDLSDLKVKQ